LPPHDAARFAHFPGLVDLSGELGEFDDTAALVANLDLVITVDTSIGHLSGALGKPTWIMLPKASDWRWLLQRSDSPWYPSVRLFRQHAPGAWDSVISDVAAALSEVLQRETTEAAT
jgi:ADP-heptose:LPS heptosyltransferase